MYKALYALNGKCIRPFGGVAEQVCHATTELQLLTQESPCTSIFEPLEPSGSQDCCRWIQQCVRSQCTCLITLLINVPSSSIHKQLQIVLEMVKCNFMPVYDDGMPAATQRVSLASSRCLIATLSAVVSHIM